MQKLFTFIVITSTMLITPTFAAETDIISETPETSTASVIPDPTTESVLPVEDIAPVLNAAPTTPVVPSMGSSLGEYQSVACTTNPAFAVNSCNQCFVGGAVRV